MPSVLPTEPVAPTRFNPKLIMVYGMTKVGKTTELSTLEGCLNLDTEKGAESITSLRVPVPYIDGPTVFTTNKEGKQVLAAISFNSVKADIYGIAKDFAAANPGKKMKFPYRRMAIDTIDEFEDMCAKSATIKYKNSILGKKFDGNSVLELPNGAGYYHLRNEVLDNIVSLFPICETVILVGHVKEKIIDKGGVEVSAKDISLTGKLAGMVCAKCDLIIYLYREPNKPLMASLETTEGGVMGARQFSHLKDLYGKRFEFSWDKIFVDLDKV